MFVCFVFVSLFSCTFDDVLYFVAPLRNFVRDTHHFLSEEDWGKMKLNEQGKQKLKGKAEVLVSMQPYAELLQAYKRESLMVLRTAWATLE